MIRFKEYLKEEALIHRGISHGELDSIIRTGKIKSKGEKNTIKGQDGLTYFSKKLNVAIEYANGNKPSADKPVYVVSVKKPSEDKTKDVPGTKPDEVGVKTATPISNIVDVRMGIKDKKKLVWKKLT